MNYWHLIVVSHWVITILAKFHRLGH